LGLKCRNNSFGWKSCFVRGDRAVHQQSGNRRRLDRSEAAPWPQYSSHLREYWRKRLQMVQDQIRGDDAPCANVA